MSRTISNAFNYLAYGLNPVRIANGKKDEYELVKGMVKPVAFVKMESFEDNMEIKEEEDKGHIGASTTLLGVDRVDTEAAPGWENKIRFAEDLEDICYMLLGTHTKIDTLSSETWLKSLINLSSKSEATLWKFYKSNTPFLPYATLIQGVNVPGLKTEAFIECVMNTVEFTFDADKTPSLKADTISNYPLFNQNEPTFNITPHTHKLKAGQTQIYFNTLKDEKNIPIDKIKVKENLLDCYQEANIEISNNIETSICGGSQFGVKSKDAGSLTCKGKIKMNYNQKNSTLDALYATGKTTGTNVSYDPLYGSLYFESVGGPIDNNNNYNLVVYIPKVKIGPVTRSRSGDDNITLELEFETVTIDPNTSPIEIYITSNLKELHYGDPIDTNAPTEEYKHITGSTIPMKTKN